MRPENKIVIDTDEKFPHLPRAPIVEAVIDIRAHSAVAFEEEAVRSSVLLRLDDYSYLDSPREFRQELEFNGGKPPRHSFQDLGLKGLRFQTSDKKQIVQFNRDGFVYSRLEPYPDWQSFANEGLRIWQIFCEIFQPIEINRIGLRFINRIELPPDELRFENYIKPAPEPPRDLELPFMGYMHHDTLAVLGYPYAINLISTIQPPQAEANTGMGLILDIDVFTIQGFELDEERLTRTLEEMRWLKNKAFFGSVTEKALGRFQ
jgi:uncharacterized protein (TIGR04255 family)